MLVPLLESAGEVLRGLTATEVPALARPLAGFDRRGLSTPTARAQLRRVLEADAQFREQVVERFFTRDDAASVRAKWDPADALATVAVAGATPQSLPLLASVLWAGRLPGFEFALGLCLAAFASEQGAVDLEARVRTLESRLAAVEEARRRAEEAKATAQQRTSGLEEELREERRDRRARDQQGTEELEAARHRIAELERTLDDTRRHLDETHGRAQRESDRARQAEERERAARADAEAAGDASRASGVDRAALIDAAQAAARLAGALEDLIREATPSPSAGPSAPAPRPETTGAERGPGGRRAPVHIPSGMRDDTPRAVEAMIRTPRVAVLVDGYNVSMLAWPHATPAEQRERLHDALVELHLRARCQITVVFDGAEVPGVRPPRRAGVTVLFSAAGQDADEVVVDQVAARPRSVPALVVSSDAEVQAGAEKHGAQVIPSALFLQVLRR